MPYAPVDISKIKLDPPEQDYLSQLEQAQVQPQAQPAGGYVPVDINKIQLDNTAPPSKGRTVFDQVQQGQTFGFGDEITDAIGALGAGAYMKAFRPDLLGGNNLEGLYNEARSMSRDRLASEMNQDTGLSIGSNIAGSVLTGVPKALVSSLRTGGLGARALKGSAAGAASGAAYGAGTANDGERLQGATTGAELGAALGAAFPVAGAAAGSLKKAVSPTIQEGLLPVVELAQKYKIPVALHQVAEGNAIKNFQKVSKELPFSGEAGFRDQQMKAFNSALIKTVGGNANKFTPELMNNLFTRVGKEFDDFGRGKAINLNDTFAKRTEDIIMDLEQTAPEAVDPALKRVQKIFATADETGVVTGEQLSALRRETNRLARKAGSPDISAALHDIENALIDSVTVGDKAAAKAFAKTKQQYKNLLVIEPLAQKAKAGNISPALLQSRVAKIYGRSFTKGTAGEIGDLARIGNEILPEVGGSDTTQKMGYLLGAFSGLTNPGTLPSILGTMGGNRLAQEMLNRNQNVVKKAANRTRLTIRPSDKEDLPAVNLPRMP